MAALMTSLGIDRLSPADRVRLVSEILDSLPDDYPAPALTAGQGAELDRRLALMDADPAALVPWAQAEARILAGLKR